MINEKILGQIRPSSLDPVSLYSPGANTNTIIKVIYVCNTTSSATSFRIFVDDTGSSYDETTALFYDVILAANTTVEIATYIAMNNQLGNIGVRTADVDALTFTIFGAEIT